MMLRLPPITRSSYQQRPEHSHVGGRCIHKAAPLFPFTTGTIYIHYAAPLSIETTHEQLCNHFWLLMSRGAMAECVFHSLWMLNIIYKASLHSNVHNAMCNIWQKYLDLLSIGESALWYWAMLAIKSTNLTSKLLPVLTRMHISGTRQNRTGYRFVLSFWISTRVLPTFVNSRSKKC